MPRPRSRSVSKSCSRSKSRSKSPIRRRSPSRSRSRTRSRSRSHSPVHKRRSYSRSRSQSRSRSRSPRRRGSKSLSRSPMSNRKRHVGDRDAPPTGKCLGVFGLSLYTTEKEVKDIFERYGKVEECKIVHDRATGRSRGFGFINMETVSDAEDAKERLDGEELDGRRIRVDYSITKRAHTPTPGKYMGRPGQSNRGRGSRFGGGGGGGFRSNYGGGGYDRYNSGGGSRYGNRRSRSRSRSRSPYYRDRY